MGVSPCPRGGNLGEVVLVGVQDLLMVLVQGQGQSKRVLQVDDVEEALPRLHLCRH